MVENNSDLGRAEKTLNGLIEQSVGPRKQYFERLKSFLRPPIESDIEERKKIQHTYHDVLNGCCDYLPLWFHGVPDIVTIEDILKSGHLGYLPAEKSKSFTPSGSVDVTVKDSLFISLEAFTGLSTSGKEKCLPAGCLFAIAPKDEKELTRLKQNNGSEDNIETVYFSQHPERLVAIISTKENQSYLKKLANEVGIDVSKICTFDEFAQKVQSNELSISLPDNSKKSIQTPTKPLSDRFKDLRGISSVKPPYKPRSVRLNALTKFNYSPKGQAGGRD